MTKSSPHWWQRLPDNFNREPYITEKHNSHPVTVRSTATMDILLRAGVATVMLAGIAPRLLSTKRWLQELEQVAFYQDLVEQADTGRVFATPPRTVEIIRRPPGLFDYQPKGADVDMLEFVSPYQSLNPDLREPYARFTYNHRVRAQHWRHGGGPRKTLIFLHGYFLDAYWANSLMFSLRWFYKQGYDVLLYTLPFHGRRRAPFEPYSGYGYFANGFAHVNEAMLQAVYDLRIWMNYLESSGTPAMGLSGLSLGGYVSALAAAVDARPAFVIPNAPAVLVSDMLLEWAPLSWAARLALLRQGVSRADMRHILAVHSPLSYAPKVAADRLLVIGGAGDRFSPPHHVQLLHQHWAGSQMHWFPGNHVLHLQQSDYLRLMKTFMNDCCARPMNSPSQDRS